MKHIYNCIRYASLLLQLSVHNDKTPLSSSPESRATGYGSIAHESEAPPPSSVVTSQRGHDVTGRQELDQSTTSSKQVRNNLLMAR